MQSRAWLVIFIFAVHSFGVRLNNVQAQTTVRPYQFGFTIEEQQHRSEKRDERGIVMGEFGFITADGIYHVTVYATDEEGRFRILAMRSYPYESPPKTIDMIVVPKKKPTAPASVPPIATTKKPLPTFQYTNDACSGCSLPKKPTQAPTTAVIKKDPKTFIRPLSKDIADVLSTQIPGKAFGAPPSKVGVAGAKPASSQPRPGTGVSSIPAFNKGLNAPSGGSDINRPANTPTYSTGSSKGPKTPTASAAGAGTKLGSGTGGGSGAGDALGTTGSRGVGGIGGSVGNVGNRFGGGGNGGSTGAVNRVGGNASSSKPFGGSSGKSSAADGGGDLYRFKYLLDYNGHTETGGRSGNKEGNYYVINEDNVERTIEYVANEFGYQPRIRWRKLPNPVQAKENTLKDYEFVWFKNNS